jgi:hypothetical protein
VQTINSKSIVLMVEEEEEEIKKHKLQINKKIDGF